MRTTVDPIDAAEASFSSEMISVAPDVRLRFMRWTPTATTHERPIFFVAGWVSAVSGWKDLLRPLVKTRAVYYLETREKSSAEVSAGLTPDDFSIPRMAADVLAAVAGLHLPVRDLVVVGSSLGATALVEAMKGGRLEPAGAFLIGPTCEFRYPPGGGAVVHLPAASYHLLKYLIIGYLRLFRVDAKKEPEQMQRYRDTLLSAKPERIKLSAMAAQRYLLWPGLESIGVPVGVAHAESDTLHSSQDIARLLTALPHARDIPCPSNKYMHSAALLPEVERFLAVLG
jgi:pimeloyl-ACP methyl ester carboxylesterase